MEYVILGKTGVRVSRIGFGGAPAGLRNYTGVYDPADAADRASVAAAIRRAYELGINYFDTAAGYGNGAGEEVFREGLEGIPHDEIFLATKCPKGVGADVRASLEASLRRLGRERIDLIQLHGTITDAECDAVLAPDGHLDALERARDEGLVKYIGFSQECQNSALYRLLNSGRFDTVQLQYNLLFQHPCDMSFGTGSMYEAERLGMGIITMRTATSGIFQHWVRTVNPGDKFDYTPALIQTVLSNPMVDVALVGMRDAATVERNVEICDDLSGRIDLKAIHERYVK